MPDAWEELKKRSKRKKEQNKISSLGLLKKNNIRYTELCGTHYRIGIFDFWPSTGKYWNRKTNERGRGVFNLIKEVKKIYGNII